MDNWLIGTTASVTPESTTLTLDDIKKAIDFLHSLPPEPFEQQMKEAGKPPEDGYELYLPVHLKQQFPNVPRYVKFSRAVHEPTIIPTFKL